jgi:hypothetical protein
MAANQEDFFQVVTARLRSETTLPIKWIAARVQIGTAKGAKSVLPHLAQSQDQRKTARALEPCAQLEFQWLTPALTLCRRLPRRNNSQAKISGTPSCRRLSGGVGLGA